MTRRPFLSLNSVKLICGNGAAACDAAARTGVFLLCAKVVAGAIRATIRNVTGRVLSLIVTFSFAKFSDEILIRWRTPDVPDGRTTSGSVIRGRCPGGAAPLG